MRMVFFISGLLFSVAGLAQTPGIGLGKLVRETLNKAVALSPSKKIISLMDGGMIWVPKNYTRTGWQRKDSERGVIESPELKISFDIGFLAGAHIGKHNKDQFSSYYDTTIDRHRTWIGVKLNGIMKELVVTTYATPENLGKGDAFPANFWAFVKGEDDIREILGIIFSYKSLKQ